MSTYTIASWEAPPDTSVGVGAPPKYLGLFNELRHRSGEWARVEMGGLKSSNYASFATGLRDGKYKGADPGEFEAVTRLVDGERTLWIRHVGFPLHQDPA